MNDLKLSPEQLESLAGVFVRAGEIAARIAGWNRNCLGCVHFSEAAEHCGRWNMRPPARVIVEACPDFLETTGKNPF
jgi:hypothetical protein